MKPLNHLKKGLAFLITAVLIFSVFPISPKTVRAAEVVNIPDDALRAAIYEKLSVSDTAEITNEQLETLDRLTVSEHVSDLTGIEKCTNLQSLTLAQNPDADSNLDLTPLTNLSALTSLTMNRGKVSSIPQISNLSYLRVYGCKIDDTASISNLTGLRQLVCIETEIAEIPDCSGMSSLQNLQVLRSSSLTDISGISGCNSLRNLSLEGCYNLTDISPLSGLGLTQLDLESVKIAPENAASNMEAIATLSGLESLSLYNTGLENEHLSMFDNLNSLKWLIVSDNNLTSAEFLVSHKDTLTCVALRGNPISDSAPLGELTELVRVEINGTQITDFSFLSKLPNLTSQSMRNEEWKTDRPTAPRLSITDSYHAGTEVYMIQNPFKDANGNLIAPEESEEYSYDEATGEIAVSTSNLSSLWPTNIRFPYTYTTAKGEELVARPYIALTLTKLLGIITQPEDVTIMEGERATLSVLASGSGTLSYQWYKGDDAIFGATSSSFTISNATLSDAGSYTVVVTDKNGSVTSESAEVTVTATAIPLEITTQPVGVRITEGGRATLSVSASGSGTLSYQWYKGDTAISGATSSSFTISNAALSDAGSYTVVVTDENGSITSAPAVVTVTTVAIPLEIITQPVGADITEGENATLSVSASGSGTLSYQWYKGDTAISGATSSSFAISNAALSDAGSYTVVVTDENGSITSAPAVVTVTTVAIPLEITTQPVGADITEGENATLSVSASGSGALSYQWFKGGTALSGATASALTIINAALSDAGEYYVVVTDKNGSITSNTAEVKVVAIPLQITTQPVGADITEGDSATLEVIASGSGALSYQWYKDGKAIISAEGRAISSAASSSLTISNATLEDAGSYTVVVTDKNGSSITSAPAVVTVTQKETPAETETPSETEEPTETETEAPVQPKAPLTGDSFSWINYIVLFLSAMTTLIWKNSKL